MQGIGEGREGEGGKRTEGQGHGGKRREGEGQETGTRTEGEGQGGKRTERERKEACKDLEAREEHGDGGAGDDGGNCHSAVPGRNGEVCPITKCPTRNPG